MVTTVKIEGMHCAACVQRVKAGLERVPGVTGAKVSLSPPRAEIESAAPVALSALDLGARGAGDYAVTALGPAAGAPDGQAPSGPSSEARPSLYPLVLIVAFIIGTVALTTGVRGDWSWAVFMNDFMAGFFLVFSFFKLLDIRGFADAYQSYDIVARRWRAWGFAYPFIELGLGAAYLLLWQPVLTSAATLALMLVGSVGVLRALLDKRRIRCACLGTALNLPMTTVTLVEDLGMAAMAGAMLLIHSGA